MIYFLSCFFLFLFLVIATLDGLYFHIYKYKLYKHPSSRKEHLIHTYNAFLFPWTILFLFLTWNSEMFFWMGLFLTVFSIFIEFIDVFEEKKSRAPLGGLTSFEYALHFSMSGLRATYTTLILIAKYLNLTIKNGIFGIDFQKIFYAFIYPVVGIGFLVFFLHLFLYLKYKRTDDKFILENRTNA